MRFKGESAHSQFPAQQRWLEWRNENQVLAGRAWAWAEQMESHIDGGQRLKTIADTALREVNGNMWSMNDLRSIVLILREVWRYGRSLRNWAVEEGIARPDD